MSELLTGAPRKKMRAECLPTRVKKAYIASWSSGVLASLSHWKSRVRIPSKLPRTQFDMLRLRYLLNAIDKTERRLAAWTDSQPQYASLAQR